MFTSLTLKDTFVVVCLFIAMILNIMMSIGIAIYVHPSDTPIFLHYNVYFGIDYIDMWYKLYILSLVGIIIFLINFVLIYVLYLKEKLLSYILSVNLVLVHVFLCISVYLIIELNL